VPPLGLSNKATSESEPFPVHSLVWSIKDVSDSGDTPAIVAEDAEMHSRPPLEPELGALTLWPESEKVFGHGYEVRNIPIIASGVWRLRLLAASQALHGGIVP